MIDTRLVTLNREKRVRKEASQGTTAEKMRGFWPQARPWARLEFLEWTGAHHLRHTKFVGLRDDKDPGKYREGDLIVMEADG
jgi:ATP-dependent DNA ligase